MAFCICLISLLAQDGNEAAQKHLFVGKREAPHPSPAVQWVAKARGATPPLLREVHAAEEGVEAGFKYAGGTEP